MWKVAKTRGNNVFLSLWLWYKGTLKRISVNEKKNIRRSLTLENLIRSPQSGFRSHSTVFAFTAANYTTLKGQNIHASERLPTLLIYCDSNYGCWQRRINLLEIPDVSSPFPRGRLP